LSIPSRRVAAGREASAVRSAAEEGGLSSRTVAEALELTDEQREKLEKRAQEMRQELQEKVRLAQAEAREKMLEVLTPEQKAKLEELMGDSFQLQEDNRFGGRGGFRGREGRGGDRGNDRSRERRIGWQPPALPGVIGDVVSWPRKPPAEPGACLVLMN